METAASTGTAASLARLVLGYRPAQVVITAVEAGLFDHLRDGPIPEARLADSLGWTSPSAPRVFEILQQLGLLTRQRGEVGATPVAALHLDRESPDYMSGLFAAADSETTWKWSHLGSLLRTAEPAESMFDTLERTGSTREFARSMGAAMHSAHDYLVEQIDFRGATTVCDLGGGGGDLSVRLATSFPWLTCTTFDLPAMSRVAELTVSDAGLADRVCVVPGDFFTDELPTADVLIMSMVLLDWPEAKKRRLLARARAALPTHGRLVVLDQVPTMPDTREKGLMGLLQDLDRSVQLGDAHVFSFHELAGWCREAGFRSTTSVGPETSVLLAIAER